MKLILSEEIESLKSFVGFFDWGMASAVGVDLAGSPRNWTGLCHLDELLGCEVAKVHGDEEIVDFIVERARGHRRASHPASRRPCRTYA